MEKIAVLLSVYKNDSPHYFKQAIESVLDQTYQYFTIFIGVDGPIDHCLEELLNTYEENKNIIIIKYKQNRGLACVLNDLIKESFQREYKYLARMDADDICDINRFKNQINFLLSHPEVDVVGGAITEIDENNNLRGKSIVYPLTHEESRKFFRYRDPLAHPAVLFRKSFFDKAKGYRPEYRKNQDTMLWFDGFMNGCIFANIEEIVLNFRVTDDFYNRRNGWKRAKQMLKSRIEINKTMNYDIRANIFAIFIAIMTMTPKCIKKFLYSIR